MDNLLLNSYIVDTSTCIDFSDYNFTNKWPIWTIYHSIPIFQILVHVLTFLIMAVVQDLRKPLLVNSLGTLKKEVFLLPNNEATSKLLSKNLSKSDQYCIRLNLRQRISHFTFSSAINQGEKHIVNIGSALILKFVFYERFVSFEMQCANKHFH